MHKFTTLEGVAAPLRVINVDTDMIIPKQYLKTLKRTGLGKGQGAVFRDALQGRRQREPGFRAQQGGLPQRQDSGRRQQLRLRVLARARALGADGLRHPLRDLHAVRRHFLQQLLDDIGLTHTKNEKIDGFEEKSKASRPWA
jgi:3-isopropylmalate dehydratase small subunit